MRLLNLYSGLAALGTLAFAKEYVFVKNHLSFPIWYTQVDQTGHRSDTKFIGASQTATLDQSDNPGVAIKISPGETDIDTAGKGVLTLAYTRAPVGWIYYDLFYANYSPFSGQTKLSGPGGDTNWLEGPTEKDHTIGYHGYGNLFLDIGP